MRDEHYTPFAGKTMASRAPMRVVRRFTNQRGGVAEIRERTVTQFEALEWMLFVDGSLIESRMYHGARASSYAPELEDRCQHLRSDGWTEDTQTVNSPVT